MKKLSWLVFVSLAIVLTISIASASMLLPWDENAKENSQAPEHSPVITYDGDLVRLDYIHYAKNEHFGKAPKPVTCYKLMGVKWTTLPVNYVINPTNPQGLSEGFILNRTVMSAEVWDAATSSELFGTYSVDYDEHYGVQNYVNAIDFGDYPDDNVIAVTSVWYSRIGKKIVEFDMRFNTRFQWGDADENSSLMDFQNIATHELGHSVGLSDIYNSVCSDVTMYGYGTEGETKKRTLEQPDITGLQKMYF